MVAPQSTYRKTYHGAVPVQLGFLSKHDFLACGISFVVPRFLSSDPQPRRSIVLVAWAVAR
jgi:hypothetical protein